MTYPLKSLLDVNKEVHDQLLSVIETFKDEDLSYKSTHYDRNIGKVVSHILNTLEYYFLKHVVLELPDALNYEDVEIKSVEEALKMIRNNLAETNKLIETISEDKLKEEITTEWGTKMTREMAVWQGIIQVVMHLGEITLMAGEGGFYKGTLG